MSSITQSSLPNKLDVPLRLSALLVLFAGVGLGLFTLSSAAGIWLGAWDYRTGLGILRMANTAGAYLFLVLSCARHWFEPIRDANGT